MLAREASILGEDIENEQIKAEFKHGIFKSLHFQKKQAKPEVEENVIFPLKDDRIMKCRWTGFLEGGCLPAVFPYKRIRRGGTYMNISKIHTEVH